MTIDQWNRQYPIGTPVVVTRDDGSTFRTSTRSQAWSLGDGHPVVMVGGITGGYSLERVRPVAGLLRATTMSGTPKWTPGPWHCNPEPDLHKVGVYAGTDDDVIICDVTDEDLSNLAQGRMAVEGELAANARLIAAAPALYDELKRVEWIYPRSSGPACCPRCWQTRETGHAATCTLAAALARPAEAPATNPAEEWGGLHTEGDF